MSTVDTEEFRRLLQTERERLAGALAHLHEQNTTSLEDEDGPLSGRGVDNHLGDMATITFDRELDEGLEDGAQQTIEQIDRALAKLDDGSYGTCERCGKPIADERLRARPWAMLCIDDQRLVDRG